MNIDAEWCFLQTCEEKCNTSITGKQRLIELLLVLRSIPEPRRILDVGGSLGTGRWFQAKFPGSRVTLLNISKQEISSFADAIQANAECFTVESKYDFIFAGEIIEHLYNPDGLICSCLRALEPRGYLVITTPNLACIYNRISLLFGWSLLNYFPSLRFLTGNPLRRNKIGQFGPIGDHKSVFTWKGLRELLTIYGLEIMASRGYSYGDKGNTCICTPGKTCYEIPYRRMRLLLNKVLPKTHREGMLFVARCPDRIDEAALQGGILRGNRWDL